MEVIIFPELRFSLHLKNVTQVPGCSIFMRRRTNCVGKKNAKITEFRQISLLSFFVFDSPNFYSQDYRIIASQFLKCRQALEVNAENILFSDMRQCIQRKLRMKKDIFPSMILQKHTNLQTEDQLNWFSLIARMTPFLGYFLIVQNISIHNFEQA